MDPPTPPKLFHPADVAVMPDGGYLIADSSTIGCGGCRRPA
jgi:hypothetical protein